MWPPAALDSRPGRAGTPPAATRPVSGQASSRHLWPHAVVVLGYLGTALWITSGLLAGGRDTVVDSYGGQDQIALEWFLSAVAHSVAAGDNPLFNSQLNAPTGVNMMANASMIGVGVPLTPLTLAFGASVSYLLLTVLALAGTATGWYYAFCRYLVPSRLAAAVGAGFCGFAPGMVAESLGHIHLVSQYLVPFIVVSVVRLVGTRASWRRSVGLGLLVAYQTFLSEEILLLTAVGGGVVLAGWLAFGGQIAHPRRLVGHLVLAGAVSILIVGYPLWFQFFGPGHYRGLPFPATLLSLDLASYWTAATGSLAGRFLGTAGLAHSTAEETSFYGLPLFVTILVLAVQLCRRPAALIRSATAASAFFLLLSLGPEVRIYHHGIGLITPYRVIQSLPMADLSPTNRSALIITPLVGVLLATGVNASRPASVAGRTSQLRPGYGCGCWPCWSS